MTKEIEKKKQSRDRKTKMTKSKRLLILQRPLKVWKPSKRFIIIYKIGITLAIAYILYNLATWKSHYDFKYQDYLITQQKMDPITQEIHDAITLEEWAKPMKCGHPEKKETRIAFLKTHKTGGSTFASILNRFVDINYLDIAIPVNDVRFNWPAPFSHQYVQVSRLRDKHADVLNSHCVFNRREISKVMRPGYRLVTILREPVRQFYSMFYYLNLPKHYHLLNETNPVSVFLQNPHKYHHYKPYVKIGRERYFEENLINNGNLYDLNFRRFQESGDKERSLKDFMLYMEKAFHLVMITEKYDESLILLKRLMCWDYMDIVYKKKLVNPNLVNISQNITEQDKRDITDWNYQDHLLYQHFSKRLDKIIALQDQEEFNRDLANFRTLNKAVLDFCMNVTASGIYNIDKFNNVTDIITKVGETVHHKFLEKPHCFCVKMARRDREYKSFFAKRFPPFYFMKSIARPQNMNDC